MLAGKVAVNQLTAALVHLRRHHAVDAIEAEGALWFYSTPATDTRTKRVVEPEGNRSRSTTRTRKRHTKSPTEAQVANTIADALRKRKATSS